MIFRAARHTNNLEKIIDFYTKVLGLEVLGIFSNHQGYDGVFLGRPEEGWHLEFTTSAEQADHSPDDDDILVFYPTSAAEHTRILNNIQTMGIDTHSSKNPYWNVNGLMVKDPDGFNVIVSGLKINS